LIPRTLRELRDCTENSIVDIGVQYIGKSELTLRINELGAKLNTVFQQTKLKINNTSLYRREALVNRGGTYKRILIKAKKTDKLRKREYPTFFEEPLRFVWEVYAKEESEASEDDKSRLMVGGRSAPYSSQQLANIFIGEFRKAKVKLKLEYIDSKLKEYFCSTISKNTVYDINTRAIEKAFGNVKENAARALIFLEMLATVGFGIHSEKISKRAMIQEIIRAQKKAFMQQNPEGIWNRHQHSEIPNRIKTAADDTDFLILVGFSPKLTQNGSRTASLLTLFSLDGCHTRSDSMIFSCYGYSSNYENVNIGHTVGLVPEAEKGWRSLIALVTQTHTCLDKGKITFTGDGQKGMRKAKEALIAHAKFLRDSKHKAANIKTKTGANSGIVQKYWDCVYAANETEYVHAKTALERAVESAPNHIQNYIDKIGPEHELYPYKLIIHGRNRDDYERPDLHGRVSSQLSESMNNANLPVRKLHIAKNGADLFLTLYGLYEKERSRFYKHKGLLERYASAFPPKVDTWIEQFRRITDDYTLHVETITSVRVVEADGAECIVNYYANALVNEEKLQCSCSILGITKLGICSHKIKAATHFGLTEEQIIGKLYSTGNWKKQYEQEFPLITRAQVEAVYQMRRNEFSKLDMGVVCVKAGRPKNNKRLPSAIDFTSARRRRRGTLKCGACRQTGHRRNNPVCTMHPQAVPQNP